MMLDGMRAGNAREDQQAARAGRQLPDDTPPSRIDDVLAHFARSLAWPTLTEGPGVC